MRQITTASFNTRQIILSVYKNSPNNSSKPALIYLSNINAFVSEQSKLSLHHCLQSRLVICQYSFFKYFLMLTAGKLLQTVIEKVIEEQKAAFCVAYISFNKVTHFCIRD